MTVFIEDIVCVFGDLLNKDLDFLHSYIFET